jgi:SMI1-KNR4 cell-wall
MINIYDAVAELKKLRFKLPNSQALPDRKILDSYEKDLGFKFPDEYRYFLINASDSVFNGRDCLRVTDNRSSPRELIVVANEAWRSGVSQNFLPFCEDNGDYYCINNYGEVKFWSHDGPSDENWPNLAAWIKKVWMDEE